MQNSLNVYIEGIYVDVTRGVVIDVRTYTQTLEQTIDARNFGAKTHALKTACRRSGEGFKI